MTLDVHKALVADIDRFLARTGISATYFGKLAANNSAVVARLKAGGSITGVTEQRLRDYMARKQAVAE